MNILFAKHTKLNVVFNFLMNTLYYMYCTCYWYLLHYNIFGFFVGLPEPSSLVDHRTSLVTVSLMLVGGTLVSLVGYLGRKSLCGLYGGLRAIVIYTVVIFIPVSIYAKKRHLRLTLWNEVKSLCFRETV